MSLPDLNLLVTLDVLLAHPYLNPYPSIGQAIEGIASMQIQCQGTLGGELLQRPQRCLVVRMHKVIGEIAAQLVARQAHQFAGRKVRIDQHRRRQRDAETA